MAAETTGASTGAVTDEDRMRAYLQGTNDRNRGKAFGHSFSGPAICVLTDAYREGWHEKDRAPTKA